MDLLWLTVSLDTKESKVEVVRHWGVLSTVPQTLLYLSALVHTKIEHPHNATFTHVAIFQNRMLPVAFLK